MVITKPAIYLSTALTLSGLTFSTSSAADVSKELESLKAENKVIMERLDAAMDMMEKDSAKSAHGHGGKGKTTIGGYGELHYNNLENQKDNSEKKEIDFHRFVLFFGHEFTDSIRVFSEFELEHALAGDGAGKPGEVELEQAYIEFDINKNLSAKGGVFLVPIGIINETHEPPTFYGTERNNVEKNIIPSTWWEAGVAISGHTDNAISYQFAIHSGLNTSVANNYAVRKGRQKVAEAQANDLAYTAALKYTGIAGLELAAAYQHQSDITQGNDATAGSASLFETHAIWQSGPFAVKALYASWELDGAGPAAVGADEQTGWYIEPSYKVNSKFGVFARQSTWDNQAGDNTDSEYSQTDYGINYWPHEDVVIKLDYQDQDAPTGKDEYDGINIGIGYQF